MKPILVFDLDGTLVDSRLDLVPALNATIASAGLPAMAHEDVAHYTGLGVRAMLMHAFEFYDRPTNEGQITELFDEYLIYYEDHIADNTIAFEGAIEALDRLRQQGWISAICTNKHVHMARKLIAELKLDDRFEAICGSDSFSVSKPDPGHLWETIKLANGDVGRAIMIGDTKTDIVTAKAANIPVIAVDFGYSDQHVSAFEPDHIISHFDQLEATINLIGA